MNDTSNKQINHKITSIMKKVFTIVLLLAFASYLRAEEVIIGSGTQTSSNLPTNTFTTSLTQQIFTASEINHEAGAINAISFYAATGESTSRQISLFMDNTTASSFGSQTIPVSGSRVFHGYWDVAAGEGWYTIVFDDNFQYDGTSNILVTFNDYGTDMTWSPRNFRVYETGSNRAIYAHSDGFFFSVSEPNDGTAISQNNQVKLHFLDGTTIVSDPSPIAMGERPIGAWMRPIPFTLTNTGEACTVTDMSVTGDFFTLIDVEVPFEFALNESRTFSITTGSSSAGQKTENVVVTFTGGQANIPVTATAYTPVSPDVWEMAQVVSFSGNTYTNTPSYSNLKDNYLLPGSATDGKDAVYKVVLNEDVLLSASVSGTNGKVALYEEGFGGVGGPSTDNNYTGPIANAGCPTSCSFDWDTGDLQGWTLIDADGDGYNWENRNGYLASDSYYHTGNNWHSLTPDNFVISPEKYTISATSVLHYNIGCTSDEFLEHYGVFVSTGSNTNPNDFMLVFEEQIDNYGFEERTLSLESYAGLDVYIAFRHYDVENEWTVVLDDVSLTSGRETRSTNNFTDMTVAAGTYYLAASATASFSVSLQKSAIPVPVAATNPTPSHNAIDVEPNLSLRWSLGQYTTEYQLKFGTTNPPQEVLQDWTGDLDEIFAVFNLVDNTRYYWQVNERNTTGTTQGDVWSFTTPLHVPVLEVTNAYLYPNESTTLQWNVYKQSDRAITGYKVLKDGQQIGETSETSYLVENLGYNINGYKFTVVAVYEEGESHPSNEVTVKVTGNGNVSGVVYGTNGTTPMPNATVTVLGVDEHGAERNYQFTTNGSGQFSGALLAGRYRAYASANGCRDSYNEGPIVVAYQGTASGVSIVMHTQTQSVANVQAVEISNNAVKVTWDAVNDPNYNVQYYNVYRRHEGNVETIATKVTATQFIDTDWSVNHTGEYEWGVNCVFEGGYSQNIAYAYAHYGNGFPEGYHYYDLQTPLKTATYLSDEHEIYAGDVAADGYLYGTYADVALGICQTLYLYKIDLETGAILWEQDIFVDHVSQLITGMAYDLSTNQMFCIDLTGQLTVMNLTNGQQTVKGNFGMVAMGLASTYDGRLYIIDQEGDIYELDKNNATPTYIASTGKLAPYLQSVYVSRVTNKTYWHQCAGDYGMGFYELNLATGETKYICESGQMNVLILPSIMPAPESAIAWSETLVGIEEDAPKHVVVYPNPTNGEVFVQAEGLRRVSVCNLQGQVLYDAAMQTDAVTLDLSRYDAGLYLLRVTTGEGVSTRRVAVVR